MYGVYIYILDFYTYTPVVGRVLLHSYTPATCRKILHYPIAYSYIRTHYPTSTTYYYS